MRRFRSAAAAALHARVRQDRSRVTVGDESPMNLDAMVASRFDSDGLIGCVLFFRRNDATAAVAVVEVVVKSHGVSLSSEGRAELPKGSQPRTG